MKTSEKVDLISTAFVAAQVELKNAVFDKLNPHFKSKYATLPGMRDSVVPVLAKHGLGVIQGATIHASGNPAITTRLLHTSGQWIESDYPFPIDKPQQMGSAMTYARRYSLAAICGIASEEDDDGHEAQKTTPQSNVIPTLQKPFEPTKGSGIALKDALCREVANLNGLAALTAWGKENAMRIAELHSDLQDVVRNSYLDRMTELKEKAAA